MEQVTSFVRLHLFGNAHRFLNFCSNQLGRYRNMADHDLNQDDLGAMVVYESHPESIANFSLVATGGLGEEFVEAPSQNIDTNVSSRIANTWSRNSASKDAKRLLKELEEEKSMLHALSSANNNRFLVTKSMEHALEALGLTAAIVNGYVTIKAFKSAYRENVLRTHPDKNPGHEDEFYAIQKAYEYIKLILCSGDTNQSNIFGVAFETMDAIQEKISQVRQDQEKIACAQQALYSQQNQRSQEQAQMSVMADKVRRLLEKVEESSNEIDNIDHNEMSKSIGSPPVRSTSPVDAYLTRHSMVEIMTISSITTFLSHRSLTDEECSFEEFIQNDNI